MLDNYVCYESVEDSYRYFENDYEVEWYFCEQNEIEVECYED